MPRMIPTGGGVFLLPYKSDANLSPDWVGF